MAEQPHLVILGGGFGGLYAARELADAPLRITLLDRRNHHVFQPLLYQVATAALNPGDIAYPLRAVLRHQRNCRVLLGEARAVDLAAKRIEVDDGALGFDMLLIATGATHSYFGHDDWAEHAPGLKSIEDATEIRRRVLRAYEAAEREPDPDQRREWLTFVVIGAGPTGVELAGTLAEIGRFTVAGDFRRIDPSKVRVVLVEGDRRVLPTYPQELSDRARRHLEELGVEVRLGELATHVDDRAVRIGEDTEVRARTVLWAAGVQASPLARTLGVDLDRAGRIAVLPDLSVPGHPDVFVAGDLMALAIDGQPVPGVAQAAIQSGRHAARNIVRRRRGEPTLPFRYRDKGALATIGRHRAVADFGRLRFAGWPAWMLWWAVHILFLIGFRNRLMVFLGWMWSYLTFKRGARLITGPVGRLPPLREDRGPPDDPQRPGDAQRGTPAGGRHRA